MKDTTDFRHITAPCTSVISVRSVQDARGPEVNVTTVEPVSVIEEDMLMESVKRDSLRNPCAFIPFPPDIEGPLACTTRTR
jgi:hypothetical protein